MRKRKNEYMAFKEKYPDIDIGLMLDAFEKCQGEFATI